jgi:hypothetical protein
MVGLYDYVAMTGAEICSFSFNLGVSITEFYSSESDSNMLEKVLLFLSKCLGFPLKSSFVLALLHLLHFTLPLKL